jgi:cytochrome c oxidase subunit II
MINKITRTLGAASLFLAAVVSSYAAQAGDIIGQPKPWGIGFQTAASPVKEKMEHFHNVILLPITVVITIFVMLLLGYVMVRFRAKANPVPSKTTHNVMLEIIWTLVPVIILVVIVIPSMKMLYFADRTQEAEMTLKITGYQWYWGYEYPDHGGVNFLSNMIAEKELQPGQVRLLSTDNPIVLPVDTNIRILVTAADVIHSWAMPSFGVKMDAVPGQMNETWTRIEKPGIYFGQCSEICGVNHAYMPIEVHAVSKEDFAIWVKKNGGAMPAPATAAE